jgi:tetratricopeptide (TPR) repeat protein
MADINEASTKSWTSVKANSLAAVCLLAGIAGGWFIRGSQNAVLTGAVVAASVPVPSQTGSSPASQVLSQSRLREMADAQAAPMLKKLKSSSNNPELFTGIGNIYYDAQQYPIAVSYYERALRGKPADAAVRTDMATAYWYMGNADEAIAQFNKALTYGPNQPNTLFNRGLVKWQGKKDSAGAVADWEKLLAVDPNYEEKDKVKEMIAEAKKQGAVKP